ncbi:MAG TPA: molybdopterin-dependent oxidoreductase, partial [Thermoanaerobaculia bacterium]|nr:molybdopterin-dependent oxidoreductase [Thermoanaerobaculia bacterium]
AAAAGSLGSLPGLRASRGPIEKGLRTVPTFCDLCFWKCNAIATVRDGVLWKIEGNPDDPLSRGRLCPRGTGGVGAHFDSDRLRAPLLRKTGRRGDQSFEEVSWGKALDFTAEKLLKIKKESGPDKIALFSHGNGGSFFKHLLFAYGSGNVTAPSYGQCRGPREVGFQLTFGSPVGSPEVLDIGNSRCLTLMGSHLGENMHNTQVQDFARAIGNGATVIVVDPRFSTAAGKARYWLPIKPGTDLALLLAWMHVIVAEGLYDREYVEKYATGFDELKKHVEGRTPEWAFTETGIAPETIVETARVIAGARPASLVHPGRHTTWYGDDTQRSRAVAILNALLGSWGRRGGFFVPAALPLPKYPVPDYPEKPKTTQDHPDGVVYPFADEVLSHGICDATTPGRFTAKGGPVKGWMVYGTNLLQALPQRPRVIESIQNLDLLVAIDVLPAEITGFADVVLPEATYLERWDDVGSTPWSEPFLSLRQPVVPPLYESKPGWWIAKELANRMDLGRYFPWNDAEKMVRTRVEQGGYDFALLKRTGVLKGKPVPVTTEDGLELAFRTPSKKIEIYSKQMADAGLPPLPDYTRHPQPADGQFRLLFGRTPTHTFGRTTNNRFLSEVYSENEVWLNAKTAREKGLANGERVVLVNEDGVRSAPARVKATERIRPDCVFVVHGYGHDSPGLRFARGRGLDDSKLVTRVAVDPVAGSTGMSVNFVTVERA